MRSLLIALTALLYACEECPTYEACIGTARDATVAGDSPADTAPTGDTDTEETDTGAGDTGEPLGPDGEDVFFAVCSECHGEDGRKGNGCAILPNVVPGKTADDLSQIVSTGYGEMPAQKMSPDEQAAVIDYVLERWGD